MGNLFKKKREQDYSTEESFQRRSNISHPGTNRAPFAVLPLDEYLRDELRSAVSNSSYVRTSEFNSEESDTASDQDIEKSESTTVTVEELEHIYKCHKAMTPQSAIVGVQITNDTLKTVRHLFDLLQTDMIFEGDNYEAFMQSDTILIKNYSKTEIDKMEYNAKYMFLRHSVKMIITYKMILDQLEINMAKEFLQQLAVIHGSLDITEEDYKAMNLLLMKYLLQRNLIDNESVMSVVEFLSLVSDEMKSIPCNRSNKARTSDISTLEFGSKPYINKDNHRCMKNWSQVVSIINTKTNIIQKQMRIHKTGKLNDLANARRLKMKMYEEVEKRKAVK